MNATYTNDEYRIDPKTRKTVRVGGEKGNSDMNDNDLKELKNSLTEIGRKQDRIQAELDRRGIEVNSPSLGGGKLNVSESSGDSQVENYNGSQSEIDPIFGKAAQLIFRAGQGDTDAFKELQGLGITKALQEDTDSEGGFLVPTVHMPEVLSISDAGNLEPLCRRVAMNTKTVQFPDLSSTVSAGWVAEEGAIGETEPVLAQVELTAKKLSGYLKLSNELIEDSRPDVIQFVNSLMIESVSKEIDNQVLNGLGDPCSGVLSGAAGYSVVMGAGLTNFSAVTGTHLSEMISKLNPSVLSQAVFVMHPSVLHYVRTLKDDNNQFIYAPIGGGQSGTIWGKRVIACNSAPSSSAADTPFIVFGNFNYFLLGVRTALSMAVDPYGLFTTNQSRIRWVRRVAPLIGRSDAFVTLNTAAS